MRVMDIEMRTWYGAPAYFVLGAVHAVVFWVTVSFLTPFVLLVCLFNERRRCCTTCWSAPSSSTIRRARRRCARSRRPVVMRVELGPLTRADSGAMLQIRRQRAIERRDPAFARHAAVLPDRALALPLSAGPGGAQGVHPSGRRAAPATQRSAHPRRLPPQPVDRLPAGLRDLPRLRLGARDRRGLPPDAAACGASPSATPTSSATCARRCRPPSNIRCSAPISIPATATAAWPT